MTNKECKDCKEAFFAVPHAPVSKVDHRDRKLTLCKILGGWELNAQMHVTSVPQLDPKTHSSSSPPA